MPPLEMCGAPVRTDTAHGDPCDNVPWCHDRFHARADHPPALGSREPVLSFLKEKITMRVNLDIADAVIDIGDKGLQLALSDNAGSVVGHVRIGHAGVEWRRGASRVGRAKRIPLPQFIAALETAIEAGRAAGAVTAAAPPRGEERRTSGRETWTWPSAYERRSARSRHREAGCSPAPRRPSTPRRSVPGHKTRECRSPAAAGCPVRSSMRTARQTNRPLRQSRPPTPARCRQALFR